MYAACRFMNAPRVYAGRVSACHIGIVAVFKPFPKPVITRAMINWIRPKEVACRILPSIIIVLPVNYTVSMNVSSGCRSKMEAVVVGTI